MLTDSSATCKPARVQNYWQSGWGDFKRLDQARQRLELGWHRVRMRSNLLSSICQAMGFEDRAMRKGARWSSILLASVEL
jgi:hypothetical protein